MTEKQVLEKIKKIIGKYEYWVEFFLKGVSIAEIRIEDEYGSTKREIMKQFEVKRIGREMFNIWWSNEYGWTCITFDDCEVRSL